jgi:hypothetical protein
MRFSMIEINGFEISFREIILKSLNYSLCIEINNLLSIIYSYN